MQKRATELIRVDDIEVGERMRTADDEAVARLARSMQDIGLRTPISIRVVEDVVIRGENWANAYFLVTGATRLAAAKQLGWEKIECFVYETCDEIDAQLWEIAENLHRAGLTKEERDAHIRRYAALLKEKQEAIQVGQTVVPEIGYGKPPPQQVGVARLVAEKTGMNVRTVQRVLNPAPPKPAPAPLDDAETEEQWLASIMRVWNRGSRDWRDRFLASVDKPVMDRRFA